MKRMVKVKNMDGKTGKKTTEETFPLDFKNDVRLFVELILVTSNGSYQ